MIDIRGLAYIVAEAQDPQAWRRYGEDVLGTMAQDAPGGGVYLKVDERHFRIAVVKGDSNRYFASGWEVASQEAFDAAIATLHKAGVEPQRADAALKEARKVLDLVWFTDPSGNRHELVLGFKSDFKRFASSQGVPYFITGSLGMGHTVLPAPNFDATCAFFRDVFGFGLSDTFTHRFGPDAPAQRIHFLHCNNQRHHSLALFEGAVPSGCVHIMLEVPAMDEVGRAQDRMRLAGVKLMATLGRHVNDEMISFYMATPSGFALEYGCQGLLVDWEQHTVFESTAVSQWGHDFSVGFRE
jgi:3,4-dihydroxy-9,10-secoandrosta-1,3,5(10)-triene-9,17-dione 4,5-dioxygenase